MNEMDSKKKEKKERKGRTKTSQDLWVVLLGPKWALSQMLSSFSTTTNAYLCASKSTNILAYM